MVEQSKESTPRINHRWDRVNVPVPHWLARILRSAKKDLFDSSSRPGSQKPNLIGDRDIEWSWIAANLPRGTGRALDFGCGNSFLGLAAAEAGYTVVGFDLGLVEWPWVHPGVTFKRGDILEDHFDADSFDLVINCSAIEHVGLSGRYGVDVEVDDGDLEAMRRLFESMKPGGVMLLTIPVGLDAVFEPMTRIYGPERLPVLIADFNVESETYWTKNDENRWIQRDRERALSFEAYAGSPSPLENCYGLGCLKLIKPRTGKPAG